MKLRNIMVTLVPTDWTAEDALFMVDLLSEAIEAIWRVHGEAMDNILFAGEASSEVDNHVSEEEIPF
jgi:hypothetical protein